MNGIKIRVGDIIELSRTRMSTVDDWDLEKCTVLACDDVNGRIEVVFNNNNAHNEQFFPAGSAVEWITNEHIIDIERDYRVLQITDMEDTVSNQAVAFVTMALINKEVTIGDEGYYITSGVSESETDTFIFSGLSYHELKQYLGTVNRISFARFRPEELVINGELKTVYHPTFKIVDVDDMFVLP